MLFLFFAFVVWDMLDALTPLEIAEILILNILICSRNSFLANAVETQRQFSPVETSWQLGMAFPVGLVSTLYLISSQEIGSKYGVSERSKFIKWGEKSVKRSSAMQRKPI